MTTITSETGELVLKDDIVTKKIVHKHSLMAFREIFTPIIAREVYGIDGIVNILEVRANDKFLEYDMPRHYMDLDKYRCSAQYKPQYALTIAQMLIRTVDQLAAACIAHLDIKPQNIFVDVDDSGAPTNVILGDFGFGGILAHDRRTNKYHQTITFRAPEVCEGIISVASDMWSVGALLFWLITGESFINYKDIRNTRGHIEESRDLRGICAAFDVDVEVNRSATYKNLLELDENQRMLQIMNRVPDSIYESSAASRILKVIIGALQPRHNLRMSTCEAARILGVQTAVQTSAHLLQWPQNLNIMTSAVYTVKHIRGIAAVLAEFLYHPFQHKVTTKTIIIEMMKDGKKMLNEVAHNIAARIGTHSIV